MLKERSALILKLLLENNISPFTVSQLANILNVSERSVRYDLGEIESWLKKKNLRIKKKPKIGIWVEGDPPIKKKVMAEFSVVEKTDYYSKEQRMNMLLFNLLTRQEPIIIKEFEIDLKVSETTILRDLESLDQKLSQTDLKLHRKQNKGVWIEGKEWEKRIRLYNLIYMEMFEQDLSMENPGFNNVNYLMANNFQFLISIINSKYKELVDILRESDLHLTKASINSILIQLFIVLLRNEQEERLPIFNLDEENIKQGPEFKLATRLIESLANNVVKNIFINENEIYFITIHLLSSRSNYAYPINLQYPFGEPERRINVKGVIEKMIRVIEQFLGLSFEEDELLMNGLATHFNSMIYRMEYKIPVEKPDTSNLEEKYPGIYTATAAGVHVIEEVYRLKVPSDEIAYLAFYIGAAIERQKPSETEKMVKVLLVCDTGFGTAQLLKERVQRVFPNFIIIGTCALDRIDYFKDSIDLCLSTIPIKNKKFRVPIIETSALLTFLDVTNIHAVIQNQQSFYMDKVEELADKIVKKATSLGFYQPDFKDEVKRILSGEYSPISEKKVRIRRERQKMLAELLTKRTVSVIKEIGTWEDSVKKAGQLLEEIGAIEASYTDAMIQSIYKHGLYIVIAPGIALLHARPEDGVKEVCMSLQVIKSGVKFGHKDRDPIDLVFAFGAIDTQSHLLALSQLMNLFNNQELLQRLRNSDSVDDALEVIQLINKMEKVRG